MFEKFSRSDIDIGGTGGEYTVQVRLFSSLSPTLHPISPFCLPSPLTHAPTHVPNRPASAGQTASSSGQPPTSATSSSHPHVLTLWLNSLVYRPIRPARLAPSLDRRRRQRPQGTCLFSFTLWAGNDLADACVFFLILCSPSAVGETSGAVREVRNMSMIGVHVLVSLVAVAGGLVTLL